MSHLVSTLHDAAVSPEAWPQVLEALTDAAGVAGAALIIFNKSTGNVDEAYFSGVSAGFKSDYVRHYAALDPYSPLLDGSWKKLSECLPDQVLRENEWYNDFVVIALSSVFTGRSVAASPTEFGCKSRIRSVDAGGPAPCRALLFPESRCSRKIRNGGCR